MLALKRNFSIYIVANLTASISPLLLMPIFTRYLGPEGYGIVAMFTTFITLLSPLIGLNVHSGLSKRWYDRDEINIAEYVAGCMIILLVTGVFVILGCWVLEQWILSVLSLPTFWIYSAVVVSVSSFIIQIRLVLWQVQEQAIKYGILQISLAFINGILSYILLIYVINSYEGRLWGHTLAIVLLGIWSLFLIYKDGYIIFRLRWTYIADALKFGVPLIPHVIGAFFLVMSDRLIVNNMLGAASAGIYMVAVQIALGFNLLNESFNKAFLPKLYLILKTGNELEKKVIVKITYIYFLMLLFVPLCFAYLGQYLVLFLAGPEFQGASPVLFWLILTQSFHGMYYLVTNYIFYECKTLLTSVITSTCGCISLVLSLWLVNKIGLIGVGVGSAIGMFLQFICTWLAAAKVHPMPWFSFVNYHRERANNGAF